MSQSPKLRSPKASVPTPEPAMNRIVRIAQLGRFINEDMEQNVPFSNRHLAYLLIFTLTAAALRLTDLGTWSFWVDEAHTFRDVRATADEFWAGGTANYPLSFLLLRALVDLFGLVPADLSEELMRLPFAFFGIASVPMLAIVGRGIVGPRAALLAALFLALSPWHIFWSQNARFYSMVMFLCVIAMGAIYHGLHRRSWPLLLTAVVALFLAGFSHPSAYGLAAAAFLYALFVSVAHTRPSTTLARWVPLAIVALFAVLVLLVRPVLETATSVKSSEVSLMHLLQTLVFYVGMPVMVAAAGGLLYLFDRGERSAGFLAFMFVLPLVALLLLSSGYFIQVQTVSAQYAFATLPAIYLLAAVLIINLVRVFQGPGLRPLVLRLVPLSMVVFHMLGQDYLYFHKEYGWRPRWEEAVRYVERHSKLRGEDDICIVTTNGPSVEYYVDPARYGGPLLGGGKMTVVPLVEWRLGTEPEVYLGGLVAEARKNEQDLWVILTEPELEEMDSNGRANVFFRRHGFAQERRLPNWTGPKDMVVLVYHLVQ